jgi:carboxypeptidase Q
MRFFFNRFSLPGVLIFICVLSLSATRGYAAWPAKKSAAPALDRFADRGARISRLAGEVFEGSEVEKNLRALCDEVGGRVAATPSSKKALDMAEALFRAYGLKNIHREPFEFNGWMRGPFQCEALSPVHFTMHAVALANTPSTPPAGLEGEVVDAAHGNPVELDKLGDALKGKFALVLDEPMPGGRWMHRSEVLFEAYKRGAIGLLYQSTEPGQLPVTGTCWNRGTSPVPAAGISEEDGGRIRRSLERGESVRVRITMTNEIGPATSENLVGEVPGRGNEIVIVGAHLDSWDLGQGADDNGTGAVTVLEAARSCAKSGIVPAAAIRFVLFMGEESGLCGSTAYVAQHKAELARWRAMINCDMMGTPVGIRVMGHKEVDPLFAELLKSLEAFDLPSGISHRAGLYGDHQPFLLAGVPVVVPMTRLEGDGDKYYHTAGDTFDKITNFRQLSLCAAVVDVLAVEMAWPETRPIEQLDENGVKALIKENKLEDALNSWNEIPPPK